MSGGGGVARYVSVSELYSTDEVALLLDEIRELEPTPCRGEELADCEIAGSGAARSPAPTERSWDSHAHYGRAPAAVPRRAVPLYCRGAALADVQALLTLAVVACGAGAAACVWAVTGLRGRLPLDARARLLALGALSSALLHGALLAAHVTRLVLLLPLPWDRVALLTSVWSGCSLLAGASLTLHAVLAEPEYRWTPEHFARLLYSASGLGLSGACASFAIVARVLLSCAAARRAAGGGTTRSSRGGSLAYRAVPLAPGPAATAPSAPRAPRAGTSRDHAL